MVDLQTRKFEKLLEDLGKVKGRHTELVTVYVPSDYNLNKVVEQLRMEQSTAQNIKSKQVRKNVLAALDKIIQHLKNYRKTPENGLAIFCGNVSEKEGVSDIEIFAVEPHEKVGVRLYQCDQRFVLGPLKEMVEEREIYGLLVVDKSEADIGILKGRRVEPLKHMESIVPGKTKKGGWSANRYARIREGLLEDFLKKVAQAMTEEFLSRKDIKGIIVGGPGPIKEDLVNGEYLNYEIKKKVLGVVSTSYTGEYGLKEIVERGEDVIAEASAVKEKILMESFMTELAKNTGMAAYGETPSVKLLKEGNVKILLLSESYLRENEKKVDEIVKIAESMGTAVEVISSFSPKGIQLRELGGIGALLRYKSR